MKSLRTICILLVTSAFFACEGDTFYLIPDNQKLVFEKGDKLVYQSNYGRKDTFKVTEVVHNFEYSTPKPNSENYNYYETIQYKMVRMKNKQLDTTFTNNLEYYYGGKVYYSWDNTYQYLNTYNKSVDSLLVKNNTFYNIYEIELLEGDGKVNKLYCNYQYGILRYEYPYQVYWELVEYKQSIDTPNKNSGMY